MKSLQHRVNYEQTSCTKPLKKLVCKSDVCDEI